VARDRAAGHHDGRGEVLVQVVDPLEPTPLGRAGQPDVVEHRQVLDDLAQADPAGLQQLLELDILPRPKRQDSSYYADWSSN
jgi:hypothetical protein